MKKYLYQRVALALGLLLSACQKDSDLLVVSSNLMPPHTLAAFVAVHGAPTQLFTLNTVPASFTTAQGNQLTIPADAFVLANGQRPSSGAPIQVQLREVLTRPELLLSAVPTISNGQLLESGGAFYLKITQGSNRLRLNSAARLNLRVQKPRPVSQTPMSLFYGTSAKDGFNWLPQARTDSASSIRPDSVNGRAPFYSIILRNDSLGWINCDRLVGSPPRTTVHVTVNGEDVQTTNTMVYLVFNSLNSVLRAYHTTAGTPNTFDLTSIPEGYSVTAVIVRKVNDTFYYGQQAGQVTTNTQFAPALATMSEADVVAAIRKL